MSVLVRTVFSLGSLIYWVPSAEKLNVERVNSAGCRSPESKVSVKRRVEPIWRLISIIVKFDLNRRWSAPHLDGVPTVGWSVIYYISLMQVAATKYSRPVRGAPTARRFHRFSMVAMTL